MAGNTWALRTRATVTQSSRCSAQGHQSLNGLGAQPSRQLFFTLSEPMAVTKGNHATATKDEAYERIKNLGDQLASQRSHLITLCSSLSIVKSGHSILEDEWTSDDTLRSKLVANLESMIDQEAHKLTRLQNELTLWQETLTELKLQDYKT